MKMKAIMQLEDYSVDELHFKLNDDFYSTPDSSGLETSLDEYIFDLEIFRSENKNNFMVELSIRCNDDEDSFTKYMYSFRLRIKGIFSFEKGTPENVVEKMVVFNCPAILYGLARGIIAQISAHTPNNKLILPTVNFVEYFNKNKEVIGTPEAENNKTGKKKKKTGKKKKATTKTS